jgi:glutamine synthetase
MVVHGGESLEHRIWGILRGRELFPKPLEYYSPENYTIKPKGGYFAPPPVDQRDAYRNTLAHVLLDLGVYIEYHHEVATCGQIELDFKPGKTPVEVADNSYLYNCVSRIIGRKYGYLPTFMPTPFVWRQCQ